MNVPIVTACDVMSANHVLKPVHTCFCVNKMTRDSIYTNKQFKHILKSTKSLRKCIQKICHKMSDVYSTFI